MNVWQQFPEVAERVERSHQHVGLVGAHDAMHAFRVGNKAGTFAETEWGNKRLTRLSLAAGLTHNADRVIQQEKNLGREKVDPAMVASRVRQWLRGMFTKTRDINAVVDAVVKHEGRNSPKDSQVLIALQDGDRIVNMALDLIIRSGQHFPDRPPVDYRHYISNPEATYRDPKSVLRDVAYALDWVDPQSPVCVRTQLAKAMAEARAMLLKQFMQELKVQLQEDGAFDFPKKKKKA